MSGSVDDDDLPEHCDLLTETRLNTKRMKLVKVRVHKPETHNSLQHAPQPPQRAKKQYRDDRRQGLARNFLQKKKKKKKKSHF
jgi:hypothetical protein